MDFSKLIEGINASLARVPLDLRPAPPKVKLVDAGGSGNASHRRVVSRPKRQWSEFQAVVQKMSGCQRHKWAKAGYPGLRQKDVKALRRFVG